MSDERSADDLNAEQAAQNPTGEGESATPESPDYTPDHVVDAPATTPTTQPEAEVKEPTSFASAWATAIDQFIHGHLRNSPLASSTEAWNHVMAKLPILGGLVETALGSKKE